MKGGWAGKRLSDRVKCGTVEQGNRDPVHKHGAN